MQRLEGAQPDVQGDGRLRRAGLAAARQHFRSEVQSRGGRGHRTPFAGEHVW